MWLDGRLRAVSAVELICRRSATPARQDQTPVASIRSSIADALSIDAHEKDSQELPSHGNSAPKNPRH